MLNLKPYSQSSLDFLKSVISSKRNSRNDTEYRNRLQSVENIVKTHFNDYDNLFNTNLLESLTPGGYIGQQKSDLLSLYNFQSVIMQKLKSGVTTIELKRVISTCQNCTISAVNSFDHNVPQAEFPEFVVQPKNLFPSCTECNSYKSNIWRNNGSRLFLNLYIDQLPSIEYLGVILEIRPRDISATFSITHTSGLDAQLFEKISYHYEKLHLCTRFSANIDKVVTPLKHSIASSLKFLTIDEAVEVALNTTHKNRISFGFNYWKSILEKSLLLNPDFLQMCVDEHVNGV